MRIFDRFKKRNPDERQSEAAATTTATLQEAPFGKWQVGDRIQNRYQIYHVLGGPGKSGMGIVYICYDHKFKQPVALKTFQDQFLRDRASIDRFKWEAEVWVKLEKHHNIVLAKFVDEIEGRPFIHMEYIVGSEQYGVDLTGWIWGGGLSLPLTLNFAIQFCHGMIHASTKFRATGKPFVHRDIKPSNIMITRDRVVKITDFGLVKAFAESGDDISLAPLGDGSHRRLGLSKSGNICGTPPYMSPEQCRGEKDTDARSDIYSFGCVLYEMNTRRYVFDAGTAEEFINHHLKTLPKPPGAHKELDRVVMKCLEKDPDKRYQDFNELENVLSEVYLHLTGDVVKHPEAMALEKCELSNKGLSLANLGLTEEAIDCYLQALHLHPNYEDAHFNLANAYRDQGNLDDAIREYKEALRLDPGDARARNNLGLAYNEGGEFDAAIRECEEALRLDPNNAMPHNNLAVAYCGQGRLDDAVREYKEALRLDPNNVEAHNSLGLAYKNQGRLDEAVVEFNEALRIDPRNVGTYCGLGIVYHNQGKLDGAIAEYKRALGIDPNDVKTRFNLGITYRDLGRLDAAIMEFKESVRIDPNLAVAHGGLGLAYYDQGKLDDAVREYKEALRLDPNDAKTHHNLAFTYRDQGKLDAAIEENKEAITINPNDADMHNDLGGDYYVRGKHDDAIREFKEALRIDHRHAGAHDNLGNAYTKQGKLDAAIVEYKEAIRIDPKRAGTYYNLGLAYQTLRKFEEAIGCYQEFIRLAPPQYTSDIGQVKETITKLRQNL